MSIKQREWSGSGFSHRLGVLFAFVFALGWAVPALQAQTTQPIVAIHDSEYTRALETQVASNGTPTNFGVPGFPTGFQWWPTNWHYFVMPQAVEESLRSDGTAFTVLGDSNIIAGGLLTNGVPKYPIFISLASEAIDNAEIAPLTNYVAAGGYLVVGSSAFTRNTNGSSRGDFAIANQLGVHMVRPNLTNWGLNTSFTKQTNHRIVSHIPAGFLYWSLPFAADESYWGSTSPHTGGQPAVPHLVWQVQAGDATVVATGDNYPCLLVKPYGKGYFIYVAAMQPIIGHSGWAPGMYSYLTFRKAIEWAFESAKLPVTKLSPWPYQYDSAFMVRHDLEDYSDEIAHILDSAKFEFSNGVPADYFFCTGTLRVDMPTNGYTLDTNVANLQSAVTNYGATIGPHNGGLQNPNYFTSLVETNFDYWHWGPDEAMSITTNLTNNSIVYPNGAAYALASISNAFSDVEGWLPGIESSNMRTWAAPYFNATREGSFNLESQLGVNVTGDQKNSPFPSWIYSTSTSGLRYPMLNIPVSDWYVNPAQITYISHSLEAGHNLGTMQSLVDFYYTNGLLINLYSHTLSASTSTNGPGPSGLLEGSYVTYGMNTNRHPRLWPVNSTNLYNWWLQRSNAVITVSSTNGSGRTTTTVNISGSGSANAAVELLLPNTAFLSGVQVKTNGVNAGAGSVRTNGQTVKILVGTGVTNATVSYAATPNAAPDFYTATNGATLTVTAPGVLSNDTAGFGTNALAAALVANVTNGALSLNVNGSFTYTSTANYVGNDSFTYRANDGVSNSSPATVTLSVVPTNDYVYDTFTRSAGADPLAPWQVPTSFGNWSITNSVLQGTSPPQNYGYAYISNSWTDYSVQAQIQFPAGAYGGGIGGHLNPITGAHYAVWVFPGSTNLQLLKFDSWGTFSVLANVGLGASVGTGVHTLQLTFQGNKVSAYYDSTPVASITDASGPYTSGGIDTEMFTSSTGYTFTVDRVIVSTVAIPPFANNDSYSVMQGQVLTVGAPGILANDNGGTSPLLATLMTGPSNGVLVLNSNGDFNYTPTNSYFGPDSFTYNCTDGVTTSAVATVSITVNQAPLPVANSDSFSFTPNTALVVPAPGVLGNDSDPNGSNLVASLVSGPTYGNLSLNSDGSFTYTPGSGFHGNDSFTYLDNDGLNNSTPATVTLNDASAGILFYDSFSRSNDPGSLTPWVLYANNWTVTGGTLQGGPDTPGNYGNVYLTNNWTNYSVQARIRFSDQNAYGAGIGGRLNTTNGAHYAAWVYPEGSQSGLGRRIELIKFSDWATWGYNGTSQVAIQGASLSGVGTNAHTVKLAFNGGRIAVYYDGAMVISTTDNDTAASPYSNGGVSVDMWTSPNPYVLTVDDVTVSTLAVDNNYSVTGTNTLTVPAAGFLTNDTEMYGSSLSAVLIAGTTNGTLTFNTNGGFSYTPTNIAPYDSFTYQANDGPTNIGMATVSIVHNVVSQTITFGALPNKTYGNATFGVSASASSGLPVSFSILSGPAVITNTNVTLTGVGTVTIRASQAGNAGYSAAPNVDQSFTVNPAALTVTADPKARLYGVTNPVLTATITGFVNGEGSNVVSGGPTLSTAATTNSNVGTYAINCVTNGGLSAANYTFSFANNLLTVSRATLSITADPKARLFGQTNPVFTATIAGFVNGEGSNVVSGGPTLSTSATTNSVVGIYTINCSTNGGLSATNYAFTFATGQLTVSKASLVVTADAKARLYGATNPVLTATITGFVNSDGSNVVSGSPTLSTTATTNSIVGTYTINCATNAGLTATNYTFSFVTNLLTVNAATLTITADAKARLYGATNPVLTATITGFANGEGSNVVTGGPTLSTSATTNSNVGTYTINCVTNAGLSATNYKFSFATNLLTVNPATLTVSADPQSRLYGATNPVFTATVSGFVNADQTNVVSGAYGLSTLATTNSPAGQYAIAVTNINLSATNYVFSFTNGTLTVGQAPLLITADAQSRLYGATNPVLTATITGFVNGDGSNAVSGSPSLSTSATTNSIVGPYTINCVTNGALSSANYNFTFANGQLTVNPATLTVSADAKSRAFGVTNPVLTATITGYQNGDPTNVVSGAYGLSTIAVTNSPVGQYPIVVTNLNLSATNYIFSLTNGTLTVGQVTLLVTADPQTRLYGATNPVFTATITGFVNGDGSNVVSGSPTLSTTATTNSIVGTYTINCATNAGLTASNYAFAFATNLLTVTPASLTITADAKARPYGATNPLLTATITGFANGEGSNVVSGGPTLSTSATTNSIVGTYAINCATNAGLSATNYNFTFATNLLTVNPATLMVSADPKARIYGAVNPALTATITGFQNGDPTNVVSGAYGLSTLATTNSPAGQYAIAVTNINLSAPNYVFGFTNGTLTVGQAPLLITADPQSRLYGATNPVFTATITGFVNGDGSNAVSGSASLSTTATTNSIVGTYTINCVTNVGLSATNYNFTFATNLLTVNPATLTVSADAKSRAFGVTNPVLTATISGFLNADTTNVVSGAYGLSTIAVTNSPLGQYPIVVTNINLSATNYIFSFTNGTLTVGQATLLITADAKARIYGATNPVLTATITGFVNGDSSNVVSGSPTLSTAATTNSIVGAYTINCTTNAGLAASNYVFAFATNLLTVTPASLTITADAKARLYGATNPVLTATITGFVNGDGSNAVSGGPSLSTLATTNSNVGTYTINCATNGGLSATNYKFTFATNLLTVNPATLTVSADAKARAFGVTNPVLTATFNGFLNSDTTNVVSGAYGLSTLAVTNSPVGQYPIVVTNINLSATNYVFSFTNGTLTVGQATLLVTADAKARLYGATNPVLTATITGFVNGDGSNVVSGSPTLSTTAATNSIVGTYTINCTTNAGLSASNYVFAFATNLLTVAPASLTISADAKARLYGALNPVLTATIMGFVNGDGSNAVTGGPTLSTTATTNSSVGTYTINCATNGGLSATNYKFTFVTNLLTVNPATLTVTADSKSRPFGATNPVLTATITGYVNGDPTNVVSGTPALSTVASNTSPAGTYPIVATNGNLAAANYVFAFNNGLLTVTATAPTIVSIMSTNTTNWAVTWTAFSNTTYRVLYSPVINTTNWQALTPDVTATNTTASLVDTNASAGVRFYRILVLP